MNKISFLINSSIAVSWLELSVESFWDCSSLIFMFEDKIYIYMFQFNWTDKETNELRKEIIKYCLPLNVMW